MKKLSEIGRRVSCKSEFGRLVEQSTPSLHVYTDDERRELVREALIMLCKEWIYPASVWEEIKDAAMSQVDGLIKEQGL